MQPAAALGNDPGTTVRLVRGMNTERLGTVNQEDFWKKKVADIPANQVSLMQYALVLTEGSILNNYISCSSTSFSLNERNGMR